MLERVEVEEDLVPTTRRVPAVLLRLTSPEPVVELRRTVWPPFTDEERRDVEPIILSPEELRVGP